jgi:hypothetical protein
METDVIPGPGADLEGTNLDGTNLVWADLHGANLREASLQAANLRYAHLGWAKLGLANLQGADLQWANIGLANLQGANLEGANLQGADLRWANLESADLRWAKLTGANLHSASLRWANLEGAAIEGATLRGTNLSGATGLLDPVEYLQTNFERDPEGRGIIAYKVFGAFNPPPNAWEIAPGSVISDVVDPDRRTGCGRGINVATLEWIMHNVRRGPVWRVLIRWEWLPSVVVPYATDGKVRAGRVQLVEPLDAAAVERMLAEQ